MLDECGHPERPLNSRVNVTGFRDSEAVYECADGYEMLAFGASAAQTRERRCVGGAWNGSPPICAQIVNDAPPAVYLSNASVVAILCGLSALTLLCITVVGIQTRSSYNRLRMERG